MFQINETDYLQILLDSCSNERVDFKKDDFNYLNKNNEFKVEKKLSFKEMKMGISLFILAGYETTSTTLGLLIRNLALMQNEQQQLFDEIKKVYTDDSIVC